MSETTLRSRGGRSRDAGASAQTLPAGVEVGRYVILAVAGRGGFGVVYRAYDPELDRSVALKVLHEAADVTGVAHHVLAEARALAKLRHPNIVSVYDVGEHDGRVYVAMEYVDGADLSAWLGAAERPWEETGRVLSGAARGLAAAHAAGVVHRDFKPENILVDADGRGVVADFGLAIRVERDESGVAEDMRGAPVGTPDYLAPELYDGADADSRSDVFSFCVSVWSAAYGDPPWVGDDEAARLASKRGGPPNAPPGDLPRGVVRLLRAGLDPNPEVRPTDVGALADALEDRRAAVGRWVAAGVFATVAAGVGMVALEDEPCAHAADGIASTWSPDVRGRLEAGAEGGDEAWARISSSLDVWSQRWAEQRVDACEATHVRHDQSEALLDARVRCLDREQAKLASLLELLEEADAARLIRASRTTAKFAARIECSAADVDPTRSAPDPAVARLLAALDRVAVLEGLAMYPEGLELVVATEGEAETLDATEVVLRSRHRRGRLLDLTGDAREAVELHESVHWEAEALGLDRLAATAGLEVMYEYAAPLTEPKRALDWAPHVRAAIVRGGDGVRHRASFLDARGVAKLYAHEQESALADHEAALELRETYDEEGLDTVATVQNLGIVLEELGRYDEAIAHHERALGILERLLGEQHPHTARLRDNLGTAQLRAGKIEDAVANFRMALDVRQTIHGSTHPSVALSNMHLAHAALARDDAAGAIKEFGRALEVLEELGDAKGHNALLCHEGLAHAHAYSGESELARSHAAIALEGLTPMLPEDHPELRALRTIIEEGAG